MLNDGRREVVKLKVGGSAAHIDEELDRVRGDIHLLRLVLGIVGGLGRGHNGLDNRDKRAFGVVALVGFILTLKNPRVDPLELDPGLGDVWLGEELVVLESGGKGGKILFQSGLSIIIGASPSQPHRAASCSQGSCQSCGQREGEGTQVSGRG